MKVEERILVVGVVVLVELLVVLVLEVTLISSPECRT